MQSNQNECGLCAIASLASFYGFVQPIEFYRKKFYVGRDGLSINSIVSIFSDICFKATVEKSNDLQIKILKKRSPCILYLERHYVVLEKIKKKSCYIVDPAVGQQKINLDDLRQKFGGYIISIKRGEGFKKYRSKESDFRHISKLFQELLTILLGVTFVSIISNVLTIIIPILLQNIVDVFLTQNGKGEISRLYLYLMITLFAYVIIVECRNHSFVFLQCRIMSKLSYKIMQHLLKIRYSFFDSKNPADILFRLNLLKNVEQTISMTVINLIMGLSTVCVIFVYFFLFFKSVVLVLSAVSIGIVLYVYFSSKKIVKINEKYVLRSKRFEGLQTEIVANTFQIKSMGIEKYFLHRVDKDFSAYKQAYKENQNVVMRFSMNINTLDIFLPIVLIILCVGTGFIKMQSYGQLIVIYVLIGYFVNHEAMTINSIIQFARLRMSLFFVNEILDEPEADILGTCEVGGFNNIELDNVAFRYNNSQEFVLKDINMEIKKGQKVAIVGISGEGKTTLIKLICRLYEPTSGIIKLNGKDISKILPDKYFSMISIVTQHAVIFNATIKENILLGSEDVPVDRIYDILRIVNFYNEVMNMPMGIDTVISDQSNNLSGGQIQKIAIARCIVRAPSVLILDEATSSLDVQSEMSIYKNLKKLGITLIVISHRISTICDSDMVYYIRKGEIREKGTHEDLLLAQQEYCSLYHRNQR